jgi:phosphate-selective porin OprO/OprP
VQLHGKLGDGLVDYAAGVFNGAADGAIATTESGNRKEIAARIFAHPFNRDAGSFLYKLGLGAAITFGDKQSETPSGYKTLAQQRFFSFSAGVRNDGTHQRISPQAYFYKGPFGLMASWTLSSQELVFESTAGRIDNTGWMVAGSWVLTGEDASYRSVAPRAPLNPAEGAWGALELTARLSGLRIGDDAFPVFADPRVSARSTLAATVGLNWYLNHNLRFVANFEHATFDDGSPLGDRPNEDALLTRLQFNF